MDVQRDLEAAVALFFDFLQEEGTEWNAIGEMSELQLADLLFKAFPTDAVVRNGVRAVCEHWRWELRFHRASVRPPVQQQQQRQQLNAFDTQFLSGQSAGQGTKTVYIIRQPNRNNPATSPVAPPLSPVRDLPPTATRQDHAVAWQGNKTWNAPSPTLVRSAPQKAAHFTTLQSFADPRSADAMLFQTASDASLSAEADSTLDSCASGLAMDSCDDSLVASVLSDLGIALDVAC